MSQVWLHPRAVRTLLVLRRKIQSRAQSEEGVRRAGGRRGGPVCAGTHQVAQVQRGLHADRQPTLANER